MRVEADLVGAVRSREPIELTGFAAGLRYMEFTEAVPRGSAAGQPVELPLTRFVLVGPALGITMGRYNFEKKALDFGQSARFRGAFGNRAE